MASGNELYDFIKDKLPEKPKRATPASPSLLQETWQGLKNIGSSLLNLPGDTLQVAEHPIDALAGLGSEVGELGVGANRALTKAANLIPGVNLRSPDDPFRTSPVLSKFLLSAQKDNPRAFRGLANLALLASPEFGIEEGVGRGLAKIGLSPRIAATAAKLSEPAAQGAVFSGLSGGSPLAGALGGLALGGGARLLSASGSGLGNLLKLKGRATPVEVAQRVASLPEGTRASIGDVTDNPKLKFLYHDILGGVPSSGVEEEELNLVKKSKAHTANVVANLLHGSTPETVEQDIASGVQKAHRKAVDTTKKNYEDYEDLADQEGIKVDELKNYKEAARKLYKEIKDNPKEFLNKVSDSTIRDLKDILGEDEKQTQKPKIQGQEIILPGHLQEQVERKLDSGNEKDYSVRNANFNRSTLLGKERAHKAAFNNADARVYRLLAEAKLKDIDDALSKSNNPELKNKLNIAREHHREKVVPFEKKPIQKILDDEYNEKSIHSILSQKEHEKVLNQLPDNIKQQILYKHLSPRLYVNEQGEQEATPNLIANKYFNIDPAVRERLTNSNIDNKMRRLKSLGAVIEEPLNQVKRAFTGGRNTRNAVGAAYLYSLVKNLLTVNGYNLLRENIAPALGAKYLARILHHPGLLKASPMMGEALSKIPASQANKLARLQQPSSDLSEGRQLAQFLGLAG